jgi:redox-sensitive bicupin YhaK (pirin superfamily)
VTVHADALVYAGLFDQGESAELPLAAGRHAWVHVARGEARVNGRELAQGDAAAVSEERVVRVEGTKDAEVLVFDLS